MLHPISEHLLSWYRQHARDLPWRSNPEPYRVWVAEIIMQQTRISQGLDYYHRFIETFPDLQALASASEDEVLRLWQGLGYYSRARNLHRAAREIMASKERQLPVSYEQWLRLRGVGEYTAAAIASVAYGQEVPALDGNALRVFSRLLAVEEEISSRAALGKIRQWAEELIKGCHPGDFNQAVMDFGSMLCRPLNPSCESCFLTAFCQAWKQRKVHDFPRRKAKKPLIGRYFHYYLMYVPGPEPRFWIRRRSTRDIWRNMYEWPMIESSDAVAPHIGFNAGVAAEPMFDETSPDVRHFVNQSADKALRNFLEKSNLLHWTATRLKDTQLLSHQRIQAFLYVVRIDSTEPPLPGAEWVLSSAAGFEQRAKPRLIDRFFKTINRNGLP